MSPLRTHALASTRSTLGLLALLAGCASPPELPPEPSDAGSGVDARADARADASSSGRGGVGSACRSDGECSAGLRCLDSLSAEGVRYCAPPCAAPSDCEGLARTSYRIAVPYANDYEVDEFSRGVFCAAPPGGGSQRYCQFGCGNNQFINFADGDAACNCLPDFERRREGDRAFCTYNPQDECSFFRDCVGTPQCGAVVCGISRGLRGVCVDTAGASVRGYVDCILGSTDCDAGCLESCLSAGASSRCADACCRTRAPEPRPDAGVPDASAPDASAPDVVTPTGSPDLVIEASTWSVTRPTGTNPNITLCVNATSAGVSSPQGQRIVVANRGTAAAPATQLGLGFTTSAGRFYYSHPLVAIPALAPGATHVVTGPLCASSSFTTAVTPAGTYRSALRIDPNSEVAESDEANNLVIATTSFEWNPFYDCRTCPADGNCGPDARCFYRRCDGRFMCVRNDAPATDACTTIEGVACSAAPLWGACRLGDTTQCPSGSGCVAFGATGAPHCARRCNDDDDCTISPTASLDARAQGCTSDGYCVMLCSGPSDTCPGATRCQALTGGGYACF